MSISLDCDTVLQHIGIAQVTESTKDHIARLLRDIPGEFMVEDQVEIMVYAAVLLDKQKRVEDILSNTHASSYTHGPGLQKHELVWAALYPHLLSHGYRLRPRFAPGWRYSDAEPAPSSDYKAMREFYKRHPDTKPEPRTSYRATSVECIKTGERKYVKIVITLPTHPASREKEILQFLNAEPRRSDPHNVCVPVHGFVECPSVSNASSPFTLALMPCLRGYEHIAKCGILGFSLNVFQQALEGMAFLHRNGIAHGDIKKFNVVLANDGPPLKLYFIDFGSATRFDHAAPMQISGDESGMEHDVFKADIYMCGSTFATIMFKAFPYFDDLKAQMKADTPADRPTAAECLEIFNAALQRLPLQVHFRPAFLAMTSYNTGGFPALMENLQGRQLAGRHFVALKRAAAV